MVQWVWWCWLLLWFFVSFFVFFCFRFLLQGSYANGSAMRIAPVGVAFRNADHQVLYAATEAAVMCTHVHAEAVDAAFVQACPHVRRCGRLWNGSGSRYSARRLQRFWRFYRSHCFPAVRVNLSALLRIV